MKISRLKINSLRNFSLLLTGLALLSCRKSMLHERWISNASDDTVFVWNPDFEDTTFVIPPSQKSLIYSYEILDTKQEREVCQWQGDTLYIQNDKDSVCEKSTSLEYNWYSNMTGAKKHRKQVCTFTVYNENF